MGTIVARTVVETSPKMSHYQILTNVNKQLTFIGCIAKMTLVASLM